MVAIAIVAMMTTKWHYGSMATSTNTQFAVAVHVLTYLACAPGGRSVSSDELAASANVNPVHVRRVLGPLRRGGLLSSRPGVGGGWTLARPAARIALDQVWSLVQEDDPVIAAHGPDPHCPVGAHVIGVLIEVERGMSRAIREELARTTVEDVTQRAVIASTNRQRGQFD